MNKKIVKNMLFVILGVIIIGVGAFPSTAATMTTDATDFYWNASLGNEGAGVIDYNGEIYWCSRANLATVATYRYDNTGWWVQISNTKGDSTYYYVSDTICLIAEEEVNGYGYYLYKISRDILIEGVENAGYSSTNFFSTTVTIELDGHVRIINAAGSAVAGGYSLRTESGLNYLLEKMAYYSFTQASINTVMTELRDKILVITGSDILLEYTISYNANGGSGAPASHIKYYNISTTLSTTKPTRSGYTFKSWNTNASGTGTSYQPGATITDNQAKTLYAIWEKNITYYILDLNASVDGGSTLGSFSGYATADVYLNGTKVANDVSDYYNASIAEGTTYLINDIKMATGYSNSGSTSYSGTLSKNTSVVLGFKKITYTVSFQSNTTDTVANMPSSQTKIYGTNLTLSLSKPTRTGYTFSKWNTSANGTGTSYSPGGTVSVNQALTLYAIWDANPSLVVKDVYMYLEDELDEARLLENVVAEDKEDGDISNKVTVLNLNEVKEALEDCRNVEYTQEQEIKINLQYSVTDSAGATTTKTAVLHAFVYIEDINMDYEEGYIRFISSDYMYTLEEKSIWREDDMKLYLENILNNL